MTRIEKVISDLSEMFDFYEKIKEHRKEKARAERPKLADGSADNSRQKASEIRGKYDSYRPAARFLPDANIEKRNVKGESK